VRGFLFVQLRGRQSDNRKGALNVLRLLCGATDSAEFCTYLAGVFAPVCLGSVLVGQNGVALRGHAGLVVNDFFEVR